MAVSSYRMIMLVIFLDLLLIISMSFNTGVNLDATASRIDGEISVYDNYQTNQKNAMDNPTDDEDRLQLNPAFGDAKASGRVLWELFTQPFSFESLGSCLGEDCSYPYVSWIAKGVTMFWLLLHILAGIEIYFIVVNKKYS